MSASPAVRGRRADQGEIWADIAAKSTRLAANSPTGAMAAMYEQQAGNLKEYRLAIAAEADQCGAVFIVAGLLAGVELFDAQATFAALLPKLVTSYALDALDTPPAQGPASRRALTRSLLAAISAATMQAVPAAGLGEDIRIVGRRVAGSALLFEGQCIRLSAFRRPQRVIAA